MKFSKSETEELANLKRKIALLEPRMKSIRKKQGLAWTFIFIGILVSTYAVTQLNEYNWAWYFLIIYPFFSFFLIAATHLDLNIIHESKRLKDELVKLEMKAIDV